MNTIFETTVNKPNNGFISDTFKLAPDSVINNLSNTIPLDNNYFVNLPFQKQYDRY